MSTYTNNKMNVNPKNVLFGPIFYMEWGGGGNSYEMKLFFFTLWTFQRRSNDELFFTQKLDLLILMTLGFTLRQVDNGYIFQTTF